MKLTEITIPNLTEAQHKALDVRLRDRNAPPEYSVLGRYKGTDGVNGPYHLGEDLHLYRAQSFLLEQGIPFSAEYTRTYKGGRDVDSHLWRICHEAGLEVMVQVFEIILDRGECDEASILALTADDVTNWYNDQVGPGIDRIEADQTADALANHDIYVAHFTPEAWINDNAIEVDADGEQEWDCTIAVMANPDYFGGKSWDDPLGVLDCDDVLKDDPNAPDWVRDWRGPFTIRVHRVAHTIGRRA